MMRRDMSPGRRGRGMSLRFGNARADNAGVTSVWTPLRRLVRRDERGQALVEFALLSPLFLMLVVGVIQFAVAFNFWFDLHRLANQGARSAAVNCGPSDNQCPTKLEKYLGYRSVSNPDGQVISRGNHLTTVGEDGNTDEAEVCYVPPADPPPNNSDGSPWKPEAGDAVRVTLKDRYRLQWVVNLAKIDLTATATMRLEQDPKSAQLPDPTNSANWVVALNKGSGRCEP
jgi:TadE-like protein